jgi:hypothetical protein
MGGYGDIKSKRVLRLLQWLSNHNRGIELKKGGRENWKLSCIHNGQSYPIPANHKVFNKYIVKDICERLVLWTICTQEEIDERL